jgi:Phosphotransferase system cellobiose-specific component IIA
MEELIIQLIVNGGDARSRAMEAIRYAKAGDLAKARELIEQSGECLNKAHILQTGLIQNEAAGNKTEVTLLMVHAQDHLMNAMTVRDLAKEFVDMYEKINKGL